MIFSAPSPPYLGPPAHYSSGTNKPISRIVIHSTVSPTVAGGARSIAAYFKKDSAGGSAHYVVDPAEVVQTAYDSWIAWHAPPNPRSLGVELCDMPNQDVARWNDAAHAAMLKRAAHLVAGLCLAYNVPIRHVGPLGLKLGRKGICGHVDVSKAFGQSTHWDPGAFPWTKFIGMVQAEAAALRAIAAKQPSVPVPAPVVPVPVVSRPPAGPTEVTRARDEFALSLKHLNAGVTHLDSAVKNGRKGVTTARTALLAVRRSLTAAVKRLPER